MQSGRSSMKSSEERATSIIDLTRTRLSAFQTNLSSLPKHEISRFVWNVWKILYHTTRRHVPLCTNKPSTQRERRISSQQMRLLVFRQFSDWNFERFWSQWTDATPSVQPWLCKPRTVLLPNAYKQTTPCPKKWLACWGTLQRQTVVLAHA